MASSSVSALVVERAASGIWAKTGVAERAATRNKADKKINAPVGKLSREFTLIILFCCPNLPRETANARVIFQVNSPRMPAIYDNLYCPKLRFCSPIVQNMRELALAGLIKVLLLERLRLRGICRVARVSQTWLLDFIAWWR